MRLSFLPAALAAFFAIYASPAAASVSVTSPTLTPAYSEATSDFTVRCAQPVTLDIDSGADARVSVDREPLQSGRFTRSASLSPGQALRIKTLRGKKSQVQTVRCLPDDFPLWSSEVQGRPRAEWLTITASMKFDGPGLPFNGLPYVAVVNRQGVPVWWARQKSGYPVNAQIVSSSQIAWSAYGPEGFFVHDLKGRLVRTVRAKGAMTDLHGAQRTRDGGYLLVGAKVRNCPAVISECVDLSPWGGPAQAAVLDNEVQKLDRRGRLQWSWSTKDNVSPEEGASWVGNFSALPTVDVGGREVYDIFHISSVYEAGKGAIFAARHLDAVYRTGDKGKGVKWKLGGTPTAKSLSLSGDISGPKALAGPHDARMLEDGTVSVFDNGSFIWRAPRVLRFKVSGRSARVVERVTDSRAALSACCGGATSLGKGRWAVDWGGVSRLVTESTSSGQPVLTLDLPDGLFSYNVQATLPGKMKASALRAGMDAQYPR